MKYQVSYQQWSPNSCRPYETCSFADRDEITPQEAAALPNVGDHIYLVDLERKQELTGVVISRLFTMFKDYTCINIVVKNDPEIDWGQLIKE